MVSPCFLLSYRNPTLTLLCNLDFVSLISCRSEAYPNHPKGFIILTQGERRSMGRCAAAAADKACDKAPQLCRLGHSRTLSRPRDLLPLQDHRGDPRQVGHARSPGLRHPRAALQVQRRQRGFPFALVIQLCYLR